jgi:transglutaminase-like putative cysteine protease
MIFNGTSTGPVAHPVIQRFFDISLYFMLFTGFASLAGTGKLDAVSVVLGVCALLLKGYLLVRRDDPSIPERWTTYITLLYVVFFPFDYFLISQTFIDSLVHMVLFAAMVKIFSIHRERDYVLLAILAFAMVLAAAVLTVDSLFFAIFCAFLLLTVMTFVGMEMRRSWIAAQPSTPSEVLDIRDLRLLPGSAVRACVLLVISLVVGTAALFFLIPRKPSTGYLSAFASRSDVSTGFSEEVNLGEIGRIQQSNEILMHVKFAPGTNVPSDLRWRGVALTSFDGRKWTGAREDGQPSTANPDGNFPAMVAPSHLVETRGREVSYRVSLEPFGSRVFFVLPQALFINDRYQRISVDSTGSIFNIDNSRSITDYSVLSEIPPAMPENLPAAQDSPLEMEMYLRPPERMDPRVAELAQQISAKDNTPYSKANDIQRFLASRYTYTLQLPSTRPTDPIADFLFERKKGHCEYFASAMAVMLRTLGIPSRIVNGFRGGEYNDVTGSYIVRAKDAHSWVEAYFPGYGWYTFDPTPASPADSPSRAYLYLDAMREFWHEWVINYDTGHQHSLGFAGMQHGRSAVEHIGSWVQSAYATSLRRAKELRSSFAQHMNAWTLRVTGTLIVLTLLLITPKMYQAMRRIRISRRPRLDPHSAASIWYHRALKLLSKRGLRKLPTQTPQEFVRTIVSSAVRQRVESFTRHYERARFGDSAEDAEKLPDLYQDLEAVTRK